MVVIKNLYRGVVHTTYHNKVLTKKGGESGWLLKLCQIFFPEKSATDLALVWHWSGNDFVKAVPK